MEKSKGKIWKLGICGCAVGIANSVFGGGGGMLAVPLLEKTGMPSQRAHATAILVILPVSLLTFILYAIKEFTIFPCSFPRLSALRSGDFWARNFSENSLKRRWESCSGVCKSLPARGCSSFVELRTVHMSFYIYLLLGILGGIPAGMGMGGGTVTIPLLILVGGVEQKIAQSANLFSFLPMSALPFASMRKTNCFRRMGSAG